MSPGSILEHCLADHMVDLLPRMQAGCLVVPVGAAQVLCLAEQCAGGVRRLVCLDPRHTVAMVCGYGAVSGQVAVAVVTAQARLVADLTLAQRERLALVVLLLDCTPDPVPGFEAYVACQGAEAVTLLARASSPGVGPVCLHLRSQDLAAPLTLNPHQFDLERSTRFVTDRPCQALPDDIIEAVGDTEHILLLAGPVGVDPSTRAALKSLISGLGAKVVLDLGPDAPSRTLRSIAAMMTAADLVLVLGSSRLPELLAKTGAPVRAMVIQISAEAPLPAAADHRQLCVDEPFAGDQIAAGGTGRAGRRRSAAPGLFPTDPNPACDPRRDGAAPCRRRSSTGSRSRRSGLRDGGCGWRDCHGGHRVRRAGR